MTEPPLRHSYIDTPLGQLHVAEAGTGRPLVLLHQTPRSLDEFREVQPLLARDRRVIAMDMVGFGTSAKLPAPQRIEDYAAGVLALADAIGLDTFAVLGHHTGSFVASEVAAAAPERVRAVVLSGGELMDAAFRAQTAQDVVDAGPDGRVDVAERRADGSHLTTLWAKRAPLYPPGRPDLLDRFVRDCLAPGVDPLEGHLACNRYVMEDRVDRVVAPLLVLAATADPVSYPHTARLAAAYTRAASVRVVEIDGGTIPLMEHKPVEVAAAVRSFLDTVDA